MCLVFKPVPAIHAFRMLYVMMILELVSNVAHALQVFGEMGKIVSQRQPVQIILVLMVSLVSMQISLQDTDVDLVQKAIMVMVLTVRR